MLSGFGLLSYVVIYSSVDVADVIGAKRCRQVLPFISLVFCIGTSSGCCLWIFFVYISYFAICFTYLLHCSKFRIMLYRCVQGSRLPLRVRERFWILVSFFKGPWKLLKMELVHERPSVILKSSLLSWRVAVCCTKSSCTFTVTRSWPPKHECT